MKILVISDTHGHVGRFESVLKKEGKPDAVIHCGDICGDEGMLEVMAGCPCHIVCGNMDFSWGLPEYKLVEAEGHKIFACHGHRLGVNFNTEELCSEAAGFGADIALYGHTHVPEVHREKGVWIMNPGSLCYPRQANRRFSYGVIELKEGEDSICENRFL
ncbi:MAG: metallophosphoesterase family protein [Lachnospiraceae bacterium]|nr:metallophosphoesterase family protein [Lachnospiraceae bacterium]